MNERPLHIRVMSQIRGHSPDNMSKPWGRTNIYPKLYSLRHPTIRKKVASRKLD